jgi:tripartite-type tricarboxylate transporter receptor subunit TctC
MGSGLEARFERYAETMIQALGHADRAVPARWYLRGLMLPGSRKSVEPMAARVHPQDVRSAHQSMHHLVADSDWSDCALLAAVARELVSVLTASGQEPCYWIIDDTGHRISLNPESCILRSADSFYRRGHMLLVIAKFIPGINTLAPPLAGSTNMRFLPFFWLDVVGAVLYIGVFFATGFVFSEVLEVRMSANLQQPIVIDKRTGAGGIIGVEIAANAAPNGYTLVLSATAAHALSPAMRKLPYHPLRDFDAISLSATTPYVLVVHLSLPVSSAAELIKLARAKPGAIQIQYASSGNGTMPQMTAELFKAMAKIDLLHVPYKASPPALADVMGGRVPVYFAGVPSTLPHIKAGRIRPLGVTSLKRSVALPDLPAISVGAVPAYEAVLWIRLVAPAKTPKEIVARLNKEVATVLAAPDVREQLLLQGAEPGAGTPEAHARYLARELTKWGKVITDIGVKVD